jgi:hypothetical protein
MRIPTWECFKVSNNFDVKSHFPYCTNAIDSKHIKMKRPSHWTLCFIITGCNRNKRYIYKTGLSDNGEENDVSTIIAIMTFSSHPTRQLFHINTYCKAMCVHCRRNFEWCVKTLKLLVIGGIQGLESGWNLVRIVSSSGLWCQRCCICKKLHVERRIVSLRHFSVE